MGISRHKAPKKTPRPAIIPLIGRVIVIQALKKHFHLLNSLQSYKITLRLFLKKQGKAFTGESRRRNRAKRVDALKDWQEGLDHQGPEKERWSREARKARPKVTKKGAEHAYINVFDAQIVGMHRRTCEFRRESSWLPNSEPEIARFSANLDLNNQSHLTVGDRVEIGVEEISTDFYVTKLKTRTSKLSRPGPPDREHREQLLAANVDQIIVVGSSAEPAFNPGFVERYLMVAQHSEIPLSLVLNKVDLTPEIPESLMELVPHIEKIIFTSAKSGVGLDELSEYLKDSKSIFTGQSGVGKSSIIQKIIPNIELDVTEVREKDGKGRHTTTTSTVFPLPLGGQVIDSPGIRGLGFWKMSQADLASMYPLFSQWDDECRFQDCLHHKEPECRVIDALESGELSTRAYESYLRMLDSLEDQGK